MLQRHGISDFLNSKIRRVAGALPAILLAGCACDDNLWEADIASSADAAEYAETLDCDVRALGLPSEYARRADPETLEIARLEAERDCYKDAAARNAERPRSIK